MATSVATFTTSEFRMRFREPYVTQGLNAKLAVNTPRGIYRGFRLATHGSNDTVTVESDPTHLDHVIVYETLDGYSLSIRKEGGDYTIDLSTLVDASAKTWVICAYADYAVGATTVAELRAYEYSPVDEFTSAPEHDELVVIGTVTIPASGGVPIPAGNINHDHRTPAYEARGPEDIAWRPVLKNPGFECGATAVGYYQGDYGVERWDLSCAQLLYQLSISGVSSGYKALHISKDAGPYSGTILYQEIGMAIVPGQRVRVRLDKKSAADAPAGVSGVVVILHWKDKDYSGSYTETLPNVDLNNTAGDSAFVSIDKTIASPSNAQVLTGISVEFSGVMNGGTEPLASWLILDNFQCWVESPSADYAVPEGNDRRALWGTDLVLLDGGEDYGGYFGRKAGLIRYDANVGYASGGGTVSLETATQGVKIPEFSPKGRITDIGSDYLGTDADARLPRTVGGGRNDTYTLLEEFGSGVANQPKLRRYAYFTSGTFRAEYITTENAFWNGSAWECDAIGLAYYKNEGLGGLITAMKGGLTSPGDTWTSWDRYPLWALNGTYGQQVMFGRTYPMGYSPLVVDSFGAIHYRGVWLYDDFIFASGTLPNETWVEDVGGGATAITEAYGSRSQVRLQGTLGYVEMYTTVGLCAMIDNPGFSVTFRCAAPGEGFWIGLSEASATTFNFGIRFDNTIHATNLLVGIQDAGDSDNYFTDTQLNLSSYTSEYLQANFYMRGGNTAAPDILWAIQDGETLNVLKSGLYQPGIAPRNFGNAHYPTILSGPSCDLRVERITFYTNPGD